MRIETGCRLHFGLIDLNGDIGRVDGSIGLGINNPGMVLEAERSDSLEVDGHLAERAEDAASATMEYIHGHPVSIEILESIPQHVGLGSGTQVALAAGTAVTKLNQSNVPVTKLAKIVGRGGTSGIGTASFEKGGFILDGGHKASEKGGFLPSRVSEVAPPPVISRLEFPEWDIRIFLPQEEGTHGVRELQFFEDVCPIPRGEVEELSHVIIMKLLPSIAESEFGEFREAIRAIQDLGFKRREVDRQPRSKELITKLNELGCAAGLSSLGPAVYSISPSPPDYEYISCPSFHAEPKTDGPRIQA
jgi:beta-ribofuranosylaminobenzene 5'-phosphate synthase